MYTSTFLYLQPSAASMYGDGVDHVLLGYEWSGLCTYQVALIMPVVMPWSALLHGTGGIQTALCNNALCGIIISI